MVTTFQAGFAAAALLLVAFVTTSFATEGYYSHAVVESCQGCQLNRLPEVRKFIFEDVPKYKNVEFKHIQGAPPELVLYNEEREVERLKLAKLSREELNDLLVTKGFETKSTKDEM